PRPALSRGKLVEVPREHEVRRAGAEGRDEIGTPRHRLVPLDGGAEGGQGIGGGGGGGAGGAGRGLARGLGEASAEHDEVVLALAQLLDEPRLERGHPIRARRARGPTGRGGRPSAARTRRGSARRSRAPP